MPTIPPHPVGQHRDQVIAALRRRLEETRPVPLTGTQQGIWLAERMDPGRSGYHDVTAVRVNGPLDPGRLRAAFAAAQAGHEALRCRLVDEGGEPHQVFDADRMLWAGDDVRGWAVDPSAVVARMAALDATEPFDLAAGPLWRARLIRTGDAEHVLIAVIHHLIGDGWSHGLLLESVLRRYHGVPDPGWPSAATRSPYADWLRARGAREARAAGLAKAVADRLGTAVGPRDLPGLDRSGSRSRRACGVPVPADPAGLAAFTRACARRQATPYMGLAGLFGLVVSRRCGNGGVVVSMPLADRRDDAAQAVVGCLISTVPVLVDVCAGMTAHEAIAAGRDGVLAAMGAADVPYRDVVRALRVPPGTDDPLTNLGVEEFNAPSASRTAGELLVTPLPRAQVRLRHDLTLSVHREGHGAELLHPLDRWAPGAVTALAADLGALVAEAGC